MKRGLMIAIILATVAVSAVALAIVLRDGESDKCRTTHRSPDGSTRGVCPDGTEFHGAPGAQVAPPEPKPEPPLAEAEFRSEKVGRFRSRIWPRSQDVVNDGVYEFFAPHCGLEWMVDFDGSFWRIIDRKSYGRSGPSFFINGDEGTVAFKEDDVIVYEASTGQRVPLRRLRGPIVTQPCA